MGESSDNRLTFATKAGLTNKEAAEGATVYEATAEGVTYRVIGTIIDPIVSGRRTFRAYRLAETTATLFPVGGSERLLKWAKENAERDLSAVLADRERSLVPAASRLACSTAAGGEGFTRHANMPCVIEPAALVSAERESDEQMAGRILRPAVPVTPTEHANALANRLVEVLAEMPATSSATTDPATDDNVHDLVDRIIRRSHYVALKAMLAQIDRAFDGTRSFIHPGTVRRMINDAADELKVPHPYRPDDAR